ncbi:MAG: HpcH/HpaI aldolase/citrate lyase family protein [Rhodobacteraceae bacterium]|nr:HpcH/HpaI aldolase/citrate lyase family protein [Paracoccaceae bacterium]
MPAPTNELKRRLLAGERLVGCWVSLADNYAAEVASTAGFDWLLLDGEHAPNGVRSLMGQLQAIGAVPGVIRLPEGDTAKIKQALDIGAQTLLIPMVESAAQAKELVRACRYPPVGVRGVGASLARASRFGEIADYVATADAEICLMVQVENKAGLNALDDILEVDGVDGVFVGPADLAADMGLTPADPEARATVMETITRIAQAGKVAGVFSSDHAYLKEAEAAGARFLGAGADIVMLAQTLRARAVQWR